MKMQTIWNRIEVQAEAVITHGIYAYMRCPENSELAGCFVKVPAFVRDGRSCDHVTVSLHRDCHFEIAGAGQKIEREKIVSIFGGEVAGRPFLN
jgi:hypothetical protein